MLQPIIRKQKPPNIWSITQFGGLNYALDSSEIADDETPDCLNILLDDRKKPLKRFGYTKVFQNSLGPGKVNGLFIFRKADGSRELLFHHGTKLYRWNTDGSQPTLIFTGLADHKSIAFIVNLKLYIQDGTTFWRYDGTNVGTVSSIAYVPVASVSVPPSGGGTLNEQLNLLTPKFTIWFSPDGTSTTFQLPLSNLDAATVTAVLGGVTKVEGTDFTVNRTLGTVTFTSAPPKNTNTLSITAAKTDPNSAGKINKCLGAILYDARVFMWGSDNDTLFRSGITTGIDPTYFPVNTNQYIGADNEKITGAKIQYNTCVIQKEYSYHSIEPDGNGLYKVKSINDKVGCIASFTSELVENIPVGLSSQGLYGLIQSNVADERNIEHISKYIDYSSEEALVGLLEESSLGNAISVDFKNMYILVVNNNAYVWFYKVKKYDALGNPVYTWSKWNNIKASYFLEVDGKLYFGSNEDGMIYRFMDESDQKPYNDDGSPIIAYWLTKRLCFNAPDRKKSIPRVDYTLKPMSRTSCDMYVQSEKLSTYLFSTKRMDLFSFKTLDFSRFTFLRTDFPKPVPNLVGRVIKSVVYFQAEFQNDKVDEGFGLNSVNIYYILQGYEK